MSSYSELANTIISQNGKGGRWSGLNEALDVRSAHADAMRQYQMQQQLKQQELVGTGIAHVYGQSALTGMPVDPNQINSMVDAINGGGAPTGASAAANGTVPMSPQPNSGNVGGNSVSVTSTPGTDNGITVNAKPIQDRTIFDVMKDSNSQVTANLPPDKKAMLDSIPQGPLKDMVVSLGQYDAIPSDYVGGRQATMKNAAIALTTKIYPNYTVGEAVQKRKTLSEFYNVNGANAKSITGIVQSTYHMGDLVGNVQNLARSNSPALNHGIDWWQSNAQQNPELSAAVENMTALNEELTKSWAGNNNGEKRVAEWQKTFQTANSPEAWNAVLAKGAVLLNDAAKAKNVDFKNIMGVNAVILPPKEQKMLDDLQNLYTSPNPLEGNSTGHVGKKVGQFTITG